MGSNLKLPGDRNVLRGSLVFYLKLRGGRITESVLWVGKDPIDHLIPPPRHGQGHPPLHQAAQISIQPVLEHLNGASTTCLGNLWGEKMFFTSSKQPPAWKGHQSLSAAILETSSLRGSSCQGEEYSRNPRADLMLNPGFLKPYKCQPCLFSSRWWE